MEIRPIFWKNFFYRSCETNYLSPINNYCLVKILLKLSNCTAKYSKQIILNGGTTLILSKQVVHKRSLKFPAKSLVIQKWKAFRPTIKMNDSKKCTKFSVQITKIKARNRAFQNFLSTSPRIFLKAHGITNLVIFILNWLIGDVIGVEQWMKQKNAMIFELPKIAWYAGYPWPISLIFTLIESVFCSCWWLPKSTAPRLPRLALVSC